MRLLTSLFAFTLACFGACSIYELPDEGRCDPGTVVFCRCPDGEAGSRQCKADGESFEACLLQNTGEVRPMHGTSSTGGFGGSAASTASSQSSDGSTSNSTTSSGGAGPAATTCPG